jgi:hypothetical protein
MVAHEFKVANGSEPATAFVATGENFPDGLSGGAHIGRSGDPLLLVTADTVPSSTSGYLADHKTTIASGFVYGGTSVVSDAVLNGVQTDIT